MAKNVCLIQGIVAPSTTLYFFSQLNARCYEGWGNMCSKTWDNNSSLSDELVNRTAVMCWKDSLTHHINSESHFPSLGHSFLSFKMGGFYQIRLLKTIEKTYWKHILWRKDTPLYLFSLKVKNPSVSMIYLFFSFNPSCCHIPI